MKRFISMALVVIGLALGLSTTAQAQVILGPSREFDYKFAADYQFWKMNAASDVAAGAVSVIVRGSPVGVTLAGESFLPIVAGNKVLLDAGGAHPETLAIGAATNCGVNDLPGNCSFTVTTSYAHTAGFTIGSGTGGLMDAIAALPSAGGTVVVSNASSAIATTITSTATNGATAKTVLFVKGGAWSHYKWNGSAYVQDGGFNGRLTLGQGATVVSGSCTSGDCDLPAVGNFFIVSGTTTVDGFSTAGVTAGTIIVVQTSGSVTFSNAGTVAAGYGAMKLVTAGNVSMTADDNIMLLWTGSFWDQIAPTLVK